MKNFFLASANGLICRPVVCRVGSSRCVPWGWAHSLAPLFMVDELSLGLAPIVVEAIYKAVSVAATSPCPRRRVEASGFSAPWGCGLSRAH